MIGGQSAERQRIEYVLRDETPHVVGALVRRFGRFELAEDAVQEGLIIASDRWGREGLPEDPRSWLIRVSYRKLIDLLRAEQAARKREARAALAEVPTSEADGPGPSTGDFDDSLHVLLLCCHSALSESSQIALTLRAVGGLTTGQIAHACGTTEKTMGTRISRAKQTLRSAGARFTLGNEGVSRRLASVMRVLYLIINEGYTTSTGGQLTRTDLTAEAIRLTRMLRALVPDDPETAGLLALMLLTDSRRGACTDAQQFLVLLGDQNRGAWNGRQIAEGRRLIEAVWRRRQVGPYQLQAAIAATHAEADSSAETDWPQIAALYLWLEKLQPTAPVRLARVVAVAEAFGPRRGMALLDQLQREHHIANEPLVKGRVHAVRAHLLARLDERAQAKVEFRTAAALTENEIERRYLLRQTQLLDSNPTSSPVLKEGTSSTRTTCVEPDC